MANIAKIARRSFLFGSLAIAGGVALGTWYVAKPAPNPLKPGPDEAALNAFVLINQDGVTLIAPRAEMGQGVQTTWAALLAEELDVTLDQVTVLHGEPAHAYFNTAMLGESLNTKGYDDSAFQHLMAQAMGRIGKVLNFQVTGGSTSMRDGYERMRVSGATAREMLKAAAAERLGVDIRQLETENGQVLAPGGITLSYSDLAMDAAKIDPPKVTLRPRSEWKILGKSQPRIDMLGKSTGTAQFGIDTRLPGMKFASLRMSPKRAGMKSFDASAAKSMPGVEKIVDMGDGVAVIASNTWLAMHALDAIDFVWEPAEYEASSDEIFAKIESAFEQEPNSAFRDDGDVDQLPAGSETLSAEYRVPFLSHASMEPLNATAWIDGSKLRIWTGTQSPSFVQSACADEAGISAQDVVVETTLMGGAFGRRGEFDYAILATRVAKAVPGTPVQVTWSREEDMTHDFYRPAAIARMRGGLHEGQPVALDVQVSAPSLSDQIMSRWLGLGGGGPDRTIIDTAYNQPYGFPNYRARGYKADTKPPLGAWRSVGASFNGFFIESFVDEMAHAAGQDPLDFRLTLTRAEWEPAYNVLQAVKEMSGWTGTTPEGIGRGVAMVYSFGTPVAMVIEVQDVDGSVRLNEAWIAADPGVALDPSIIEAQLFGGMVYGLSSAMGEEITFADGAVEQQNFPDYEPLRMPQMPKVTVRILETQEHISGIGEPGTPPAPPALANAIFDLTGQRIRQLPLNKDIDFYI
ncbi:xanthine dehydrogenase family protein molybdopterin-binding subunit [Tropicibacter sp. R15_0]|uniref:xanthine dehydrogenase family protein molybdopterin-binding subunit n=1 Tax=Tropicibacter sp. R15_0 TaxID=2821101 RepID=UPI001ADA3315|nr:molybdopterin cofactor-binding domain-containing protein [Tropicibacter sp. R15_0]MBO9466748.1 xanthine dehydrogenase family protein molybdopterin-binding subunit [Tropicibacter sp. R15_0]